MNAVPVAPATGMIVRGFAIVIEKGSSGGR